jgi:terminase small subunit-like protein
MGRVLRSLIRPILQACANTVGPSASMCSLRRTPGAARLTTDAKGAFRVSSGSRRRSSPVGDFLERYARAREAQADKYFQEIVEIADAATPETVNVARLRVDSRKFTVARLAPKKYGDHISHDVKGAGSSNFQPQILIQCSSAGDDEGYI